MNREELGFTINNLSYEISNAQNKVKFEIKSDFSDDIMVAYYLLKNNEVIKKMSYSMNKCATFSVEEDGVYNVKYFFKHKDIIRSKVSEDIEVLIDKSLVNQYIHGKEEPVSDYFEFGNSNFSSLYTKEEQHILLGINDGAYYSSKFGNELEKTELNVMPPFSWEFKDINDRRIPYRLNGFLYHAHLLMKYWQTSEINYRNQYIECIFDWIRVHPTIDLSDTWAWHDDATARRVYFFISALLLFEKILNQEQINILKQSIDMQIRLLCREEFYKFNHNHGMYQDRAVALYGLTYSDEHDYHLDIAKYRVSQYFKYAFTSDGVHKEHSPMYHCDMAYSVRWFELAYRKHDKKFADNLNDLLRKMSTYISWITMPDNYIISIGDSTKKRRRVRLFYDNLCYKYISTLGEEGKPEEETAKVFMEAGYGIIRKDWNMNSSSTWMMLVAATHSMAHKHNDDLSFSLFHKGELFVEAGNRNYNYSEEMTQYIYSSYGHNVLFIDDEGWKLKDNFLPYLEPEAFDTHIIDSNTTGSIQWISGIQTRFDGVIQVRTIKYRRNSEIVEINDKITLDTPKKITLIYHIAEGVTIVNNKNHFLLMREDEKIARVFIDGTNSVDVSILRELEKKGEYRTWIFNGNPEPVYGSLIIVNTEGRKSENEISLVVELL